MNFRLFPVLLLAAFSPVSADLVKVDGGKVTFAAPEGFKPVPQDIIDLKWPSKQAPKFVIGVGEFATTIAYDLKAHKLPEADLEEAKKSFTDLFTRIIPGIEWKKNEILELAGRKWIYFEMTSSAVDTDIYNMMLVTGHGDQMLLFNFNSTKEEFPKYEAVLRKSMNSIAFPEEGEGKNPGGGDEDEED